MIIVNDWHVESVSTGDGHVIRCLHEAALMGMEMNVKHSDDSEDTRASTSEKRSWSRQTDQAVGSLRSFIAFSAFKQNCDSFENYTNLFACAF